MGQFMLLLSRGFGAYLSPHFRCARAHGIQLWPIAHSHPHHGRAGHIHKTLCCPWPEMERCTKLQQVRAVTAPTKDAGLKWSVCVNIRIGSGSWSRMLQKYLHKFLFTSLKATFYCTCCGVDCCQWYSCLATASME